MIKTILDNKQIGLRIKRLRSINNLTQNELAIKLGVQTQTISKYERGVGLPDIGFLVGMADIFECSTDYIIGRDNYLPEKYWKAVHVNLVDVTMIYESAKKITDLIDNAKK
jgi:transcriptional regulator with XRE-family HTH domain